MESHVKSFHLETPFPYASHPKNFSKNKQSLGYTSSVKSSNYAGDGTFADVVEYNKHLRALKDLEILKSQYYDDYVENLERKVWVQRKELAKSETAASVKSHRSRYNKKKFPKLQHHKLRHDRDYMQKVSKSKYYYLLAARDMMMQKELIKSKSDEDQFWHQALHDDDLWSRPLPADVPSDILSRLIVDRFSSRRPPLKTTVKKNRRVTFNESPTKSFATVHDSDGTEVAKDPNLLRFKVKLNLPKLHSMKKLSPLPPIERSTESLTDSADKIKHLKKYRSVQHAYDVSMVNYAAAHQMLKRHGLSPDNPSDFLTDDIPVTSSKKQLTPPIDSKGKTPSSVSRGKDKQVFITEPVYGPDEILIPDLEYKYPNQKRRKRKSTKKQKPHRGSGMQDNEGINTGDNKTDASKITPLDYGMMLAQGDLDVRNATCLSSFWVNYITTSKSGTN